MSGPLAGVKVLELAQIMAGPTCGMMLAGTLAGCEMGLELAGAPIKREGVQAALQYLADCRRSPARAAA